MRLTLYTDYALRALIYLAERPGQLCAISEIAEGYGISRNHLVKVMHDLRLKGYVDSVRGRAGGMKLARPASEINVGDVVRRMEDDFALVDCPSCRIVHGCGMRQALGEALGAFLAVLDGYTLADLLVTQPGPMALFARG